MTGTGDNAGEAGARLSGPPPVATILDWALMLLTARAWQSMGLVVNPETGKLERDPEEARRAIDMAEALVSLAGPERGRELQPLLADLRLNYVRQTRATGEGEDPAVP